MQRIAKSRALQPDIIGKETLLCKCIHKEVECLNHYEIIRKYRCHDCGEIMMCACEENFARKYLPHQISTGTVLETQERVPVTLGFQVTICNTCKGIPEEAHPKAEIYGLSSKILRYYWREIQIQTIERFGNWALSQNYDDWLIASAENRDKYNEIEKNVIQEIKAVYAQNPKYIFEKGLTQEDIINDYNVTVINVEAEYQKNDKRKKTIVHNQHEFTAEQFTANYFKELGYRVLETESIPFHVIFGTLMWILIQDPKDEQNRFVSFGERLAYEQKMPSKEITTVLPDDFGTRGYYTRRQEIIEKHISELAPNEEALDWLFDYWLDHSYELRNYLCAHKDQDIEKAQYIVKRLGLENIKKVLKYLIKDYWNRYLGWPDLFVSNDQHFFFVEVKASKDKLSEVQINWIKGNHEKLNFPFKLFKIHKKSEQFRKTTTEQKQTPDAVPRHFSG